MNYFATHIVSGGYESPSGVNDSEDDALFLERLKVFYEQSLTEILAFAQREGRPYDQVKIRISELHCKALFEDATGSSSQKNVTTSSTHISISRQLESLESICGLQSFYLAVNPSDPTDEGFLGGTPLGREFWRGHRGCGASGSKAFGLFCQKALQNHAQSTPRSASQPGPGGAKKASEVKAEVYLAVRNAVRAASSNRHAEMKWSNHANLAVYGLELVGWPPAVPPRNPSALSAAQNQAVLDALAAGRMWFRSTNPPPPLGALSWQAPAPEVDDEAIFEDTIDFDAVALGGEEVGGHRRTDAVYEPSTLTYTLGEQLGQENSEDRRGSPERYVDFGSSAKKRRRDESQGEMSQGTSGGVK